MVFSRGLKYSISNCRKTRLGESPCGISSVGVMTGGWWVRVRATGYVIDRPGRHGRGRRHVEGSAPDPRVDRGLPHATLALPRVRHHRPVAVLGLVTRLRGRRPQRQAGHLPTVLGARPQSQPRHQGPCSHQVQH